MYSAGSTRALPRVGFPIRKSPGQRLVSSSPGLFAAAHVLHRLLAPRHPPCALSLLIMKNTVVAAMEFSRCARDAPAQQKAGPAAGLSKLNSDERRGRRIPGDPGSPDEGGTVVRRADHRPWSSSTGRGASGVQELRIP